MGLGVGAERWTILRTYVGTQARGHSVNPDFCFPPTPFIGYTTTNNRSTYRTDQVWQVTHRPHRGDQLRFGLLGD